MRNCKLLPTVCICALKATLFFRTFSGRPLPSLQHFLSCPYSLCRRDQRHPNAFTFPSLKFSPTISGAGLRSEERSKTKVGKYTDFDTSKGLSCTVATKAVNPPRRRPSLSPRRRGRPSPRLRSILQSPGRQNPSLAIVNPLTSRHHGPRQQSSSTELSVRQSAQF